MDVRSAYPLAQQFRAVLVQVELMFDARSADLQGALFVLIGLPEVRFAELGTRMGTPNV
jgi:hypothetical protein